MQDPKPVALYKVVSGLMQHPNQLFFYQVVLGKQVFSLSPPRKKTPRFSC